MQYNPSFSALIHPEQQPPLGPNWPWNEAATLAECARLAYIRFETGGVAEATLQAALAEFGYGNHIGFFYDGKQVGKHRFDTQAFGAVSETGTALVAFRGTQPDSIKDLITDASFLPTGWKGVGQVHNGFWGSLHESLDPILTWLEKVNPSRLIVTGHSLGAAQATLLAGIRPDAELTTFGSPLVGDADFAASFSERKVERFVDCLDLVARVPPWIYRHLGGLRYIDRNGRIHQGDSSWEDNAEERLMGEASYVPLLRPGNCVIRDLADHAPINYVSAILGIRIGP